MINRLYFFRCKIKSQDSFGKPLITYETGIADYKSFLPKPVSVIQEIKKDLAEDYDTAENNVEMMAFSKV